MTTQNNETTQVQPAAPKLKPALPPMHQPMAPLPTLTEDERAAADAEREKAIAQLKEWGLTGS